MKGFVSRLNSKFSITVDVRCITCQGLYEAERGKMRTLIMQTKEKKKVILIFLNRLKQRYLFYQGNPPVFSPPFSLNCNACLYLFLIKSHRCLQAAEAQSHFK